MKMHNHLSHVSKASPLTVASLRQNAFQPIDRPIAPVPCLLSLLRHLLRSVVLQFKQTSSVRLLLIAYLQQNHHLKRRRCNRFARACGISNQEMNNK